MTETYIIATAQPIGVTDQGQLDPSNMSSGSATAGQVPVADGAGGVSWSDESGLGDVTGPAGATDNAVAVFDGASGKVVKEPDAAVDFKSQQAINLDVANLDPADMSSGAAAAGQLLTAGGAGAVSWDDPPESVGLPGSSTDNALTRWDGAGGDAIQSSGVTLSDTDDMVFPSAGSISKPGAGAGSEAFGAGVTATGAGAIAVGISCSASANNAVVAGNIAKVHPVSSGNSTGSVAIGTAAEVGNVIAGAGCGAAVCIGQAAVVSPGSIEAVCIGPSASIGNSDARSVAIGHQASSTHQEATAIGPSASSGFESVAAGKGATAHAWGVAIGSDSSINAAAQDCVVVGHNASAAASSCDNDVIIGSGATVAIGGNTVCIGAGTNIYATSGGFANGAVLIGYLASIGDATPGAACDGAICVGRSASVKPGASDSVVIGKDAASSAAQALVFGEAAKVYGVSSGDSIGAIAVGPGAVIGAATPGAGCDAAIAIGENATVGAGVSNGIAIGQSSSATGNAATAIGSASTASGSDSFCIGRSSSATQTQATSIGQLSSATASNALAVGHNCTVSGQSSVAIGSSASVDSVYGCVAIGYNVDLPSTAARSVSVGESSFSKSQNAVVVGSSAKVHSPSSGDNTGAIAIGYNSVIGNVTPGSPNNAAICIGENATVGAGHLNSIALGAGATTTASNRLTLASALDVEIGQGLGVWGVTPPGSQPAKINDPTDLATAITAVSAIIDVLEGAGLSSAT